jgi:hypothetical protein
MKIGYRDQNMLLMILAKDIRGEYELTFDSKTYKWSVKGEIAVPKSEIKNLEAKNLDSKISIANNWLSLYKQKILLKLQPLDSLYR